MNQLYHRLTHDLDKITLMRRIFTQRAATRDGVFLGQLPVLRYVTEHPNCTQKDVADFLQVSPPSVAVMVKRMVRDGMLKKEADPKDMRQNRLTVTAEGLAMGEQCKTMFGQMDKQVYAGFSVEELEQLSSYLNRLIQNLGSDDLNNVSNLALVRMMTEMEQNNNNKLGK